MRQSSLRCEVGISKRGGEFKEQERHFNRCDKDCCCYKGISVTGEEGIQTAEVAGNCCDTLQWLKDFPRKSDEFHCRSARTVIV